MPDASFLSWPFFEDRHRAFAEELEAWAGQHLGHAHGESVAENDAACRQRVRALGDGGWLRATAPDPDAAEGDPAARLDVRTICLAREILARHDGLADFAFAMQGLGMGAVSLFGTAEQRAVLRRTRAGDAIAAFALSEPRSGSDVANLETRATRDGEGWVLEGEKTWISNGGIADLYVVFARTSDEGARGLTAFLMPGDARGLEVAERLEVMAPHPLARLRLSGVRLPDAARLGPIGAGFKVAMSVLDVFRSSVGAAALGFARRAHDEALERASTRELFGGPLSDLQMVQGHLADMALGIDASALLIYRAAWTKDRGAARVSREAAMAKLHATETAQQIIDAALQLHGGDGVRKGTPVEALYREIRALRIYEGASDVQKVIIARQALAAHRGRA